METDFLVLAGKNGALGIIPHYARRPARLGPATLARL
jgi:hypothetical protein